jgi:DNA-binding NarL/FixJ family response regulator
VDVLTKREILELLGEGLSNRRMAERPFLSPWTVEHHARSVLAKLELANRAEAAAYCARVLSAAGLHH